MAGRAVTGASTAPRASLPVVRTLVRRASRDGEETAGVLGIRALPQWHERSDLTLDGLDVHVAPCVSALAVREAIANRRADQWLVILTDRPDADLGVGIRAHLRGRRLYNPDPWDAVRDQYRATTLDRRLATAENAADLAAGILAARGETDWPPARAGFLTLEHVCSTVAARQLGLSAASENVAAEEVLAWSADPRRAVRLTDLAETEGPGAAALARVVSTWLADRCGPARPLVASLLRAGRASDLVPLGLAGRAVLASGPGSEPWLRLQIEKLDGDLEVTPEALTALVETAEEVARRLLARPEDAAVLGRVLEGADHLVTALHASGTAAVSDLLASSLTSRLATLGERLRLAAEHADAAARRSRPDAALLTATALEPVEVALTHVRTHALAAGPRETRVARALAGVRLARWLATSAEADPRPGSLGSSGAFGRMMARHRDVDAWVDQARNTAWRGVDEESLAGGLRAVLALVQTRRDEHDREFARALAAQCSSEAKLPDGIHLVENVIADVVAPIAAADQPVLLIVADGMSAAAGSQILDDLGRSREAWFECVPRGRGWRDVAVAVLPSLTELSRASLLTGTLTRGGQPVERAGFDGLLRAHHLTGRLFHKLTLEASGAGNDLTPEVAAAVDDRGLALVACVLNTIDDALDRSDAGRDWTADAVTHLLPLLERARRAGRVVVLTSDHGHVIERREGTSRSCSATSSNRSRPGTSAPEPGPDEVRVRGRRVLLHDGDAVLAVDERLRYGPLKAGYHGGGSPAEVVIPIHVLTGGENPPAGWTLASPQQPRWWQEPLAVVAPDGSDGGEGGGGRRGGVTLPPSSTPTLFDEVAAPARRDLAKDVIASEVYRGQRARAQRAAISDDQVASLLQRLLAAPDHRIDAASAAQALGVAEVQLTGALSVLQRLLNVDQYPVLDRDPDGTTIVLDAGLLTEQFGLAAGGEA